MAPGKVTSSALAPTLRCTNELDVSAVFRRLAGQWCSPLSSRTRFHNPSRLMLRPREKYTVFDLQQLKRKRVLTHMLAAGWWMREHGGRPFTADAAVEEPKANGVAVLARAVGVEWDGAAYVAGAVLAPGTLRLKSGAALVEFYSGARVVLEGSAHRGGRGIPARGENQRARPAAGARVHGRLVERDGRGPRHRVRFRGESGRGAGGACLHRQSGSRLSASASSAKPAA